MSWISDNLDLIWQLSLPHLRQSVIPIIVGFVIALPLGWLAFRYTRWRGAILTTVGLLYTIPSFGLFAVVAAAFGLSLRSETTLIVALTIYAVAIMTRAKLPLRWATARGAGSGRSTCLWRGPCCSRACA